MRGDGDAALASRRMTSAKQGPTEKVAWTVGGLSLVSALLFVILALIGEANVTTVLAAALTALSGGIWIGRVMEAKAVRAGRNMLRP